MGDTIELYEMIKELEERVSALESDKDYKDDDSEDTDEYKDDDEDDEYKDEE